MPVMQTKTQRIKERSLMMNFMCVILHIDVIFLHCHFTLAKDSRHTWSFIGLILADTSI